MASERKQITEDDQLKLERLNRLQQMMDPSEIEAEVQRRVSLACSDGEDVSNRTVRYNQTILAALGAGAIAALYALNASREIACVAVALILVVGGGTKLLASLVTAPFRSFTGRNNASARGPDKE